MRIGLFPAALFAVFLCSATLVSGDQQMTNNLVQAELNGLQLTVDGNTGALLRMSYPGPGLMLDAGQERASVLDLAYPIQKFEPLRLSPKHSQGAVVTKNENSLVITWEKLGLSRPFEVQGNVKAQVTFKASCDGGSIIMMCKIENQSQNSVRQVIFPDFSGLLPFAGEDKILFRSGAFATPSFLELKPDEGRSSIQYCMDTASYAVHYKSGGMFSNMWVRWYDFGGLGGGFSLFPRRWGWDSQVDTRVQLSDIDNKLRIMSIHPVEIKPGETWESGEFWLTPHKYGWAKGIEPYRNWVKQNFKREFTVPRHVREGLGYRTAWMCQNQPEDALDAVWKMSDLPNMAKECKEHGLDELVLWSWNRSFQLPMPPPYPHLGTEQEFASAVQQCKALGVNVVPFVSVLSVNKATAPRYGLSVNHDQGWTFHTEMIPGFNPPYANGFACVEAPVNHPQWQDDVYNSCIHLISLGICSLGWDQYSSTNAVTPNINTLTSRIRGAAKQKDPESTFNGEELWNIEVDSKYLDYTWNWGGYRDCRAFTSVFPAPRINATITSAPLAVKMSFADNLYVNIFPRKAGSINGSDYISNYPEFSQALKQCAKLRKQFLPYFLDGTLIGDCILTEPCPSAHLSSYVLPDRVLMIMINRGGQQAINVNCDLTPWLVSASGSYTVKSYNADGNLVSTTDINGPKWQGQTRVLQPLEIALFEFQPK